MQSLQSMMLKADKSTQIYYNTRLNAYLEKPMETLINFKTKLEKIDFTKINIRVTPEKQWAYLAGDDKLLEKVKKTEINAPENIQELKDKVPTRISLVDLLASISNVEKALGTLKEKTAQQAVPTIVQQAPQIPTETPASAEPVNPSAE